MPDVAVEQFLADLDERGYAVVPRALPPALLRRVLAAADGLYERARSNGDALHLLGAVAQNEAFLDLLDPPTTFPLVRAALGWNIHMYHSHLDVHPPVRTNGAEPWRWHQDGGRQNLELETDPRPRLSIKVAYFVSDVSEPGRGNMLVVPGSHRWNSLPGRDEARQPQDAVPILAEPGTAVVFDRRLWHARSDNRSPVTRKAVFLAYTYRWIRPRDDAVVPRAWLERCSPVRRQLLGHGTSSTGFWIPTDADVPLREF